MKLTSSFVFLLAFVSDQSQTDAKREFPEGTFLFPKEKYAKDDNESEFHNLKFECGRVYELTGRIFRGENATFGHHPWQAALFERKYSFLETLICGGVLIHQKFILTAAHCVDRKPTRMLRVRLGEHDIEDSTNRMFPHEVFRVKEKFIHKLFNRSRIEMLTHDIALLELNRPVRYKKHIVPICLPRSGANFAGEIGTVTGWGDNRNPQLYPSPLLKRLAVQIVENDECEQWAADFGGHLGIKESHLCAGFRKDGGNTCFSDSGGPLVVENEGRSQLVGIVSTGIGPFGLVCGMPFFPAIYTNVSNYVEWIDAHVNASSKKKHLKLPSSYQARALKIREPTKTNTDVSATDKNGSNCSCT